MGHEGEISKVCFNPQGSRILTASSDKSARIWEVETGGCMQVRRARTGRRQKTQTQKSACCCRVCAVGWIVGLTLCLTSTAAQILEGHTDEIFSCAFNYEGDTIITGSKDNTCRIWKCS